MIRYHALGATRVISGAMVACFLAAPSSASSDKNETLMDLLSDTLHQFQQQDEEYKRRILISVTIGFVLTWIVSLLYKQHTLAKRYGMPIMNAPPEGRPLPLLGHAINFLLYRPWDLLANWHRLYGPILCFPLLGSNMFSLASPKLIKIVLQSKIASVKKDIANTYKPFLSILGTGIVTSEDESWMKQRLKLSNPLRHDVLHIIPRQTLYAVQRLFAIMDQAAITGEPVPIGSSLRHLTLQVISGTFLSMSAEESDSTFAKLYLPIVDESNTRVWHPYRSYMFFMPSFWKYLYNVRRLNQYVSKLIRNRWELRRQEEKMGQCQREYDILDGILQVYEKAYPGESVLPEPAVRQFRDEMKTFMLAGHETSAAMMTWALYELMGNDILMHQVASEGSAVFGSKDDWIQANASDLPSDEILAKLILGEACLRESLRKYSVVPIVGRRTIQDLYMEDKYFIPKGSSFLINIQAVHHDPELWPEPMKFDPTRFINQKIEPYTFLPFIAGPRNCLGQYLALLESKMVIGMLTQRYTFSLPKGETIEVEDWSDDKDPRHRFMVPVIPKEELMAIVQRK